MNRLGLRRRLFLVVFLTVALAVVGLIVGFDVVLARTLDRDGDALVRSRAAAQLSSLRFEHGRLSASESPEEQASDAYVWLFDGAKMIEGPRVANAVRAAARSLAAGPGRTIDVASADTRLHAIPVIHGGRRVGTVVAGVSLAPYESTRRTALVASLVLGGLILLLVGLATWWLLGASLRPVVRMTRQAADWSEHDLEHRFALGPPHDELTELAATLDTLLDRIAASLGHERRFSAELSHELRTPLAHLLAETELALSRNRGPTEYRQALETIHETAARISRTIATLIAAAVYEAEVSHGTADAQEVASETAAACSALANERRIAVEVVPPRAPLRIGVDLDLAQRILQPVLENACKYGRSRVRITVDRDDSAVLYAVEDDGQGVPEAERERIFEPGTRGTAADTNNSGAGLGLALARRLARTVHGDVVADLHSGGHFTVRLPTG